MISTSNDTVLRKDMPFGGTTNENEIVHFDHSFVKKKQKFLDNFWRDFENFSSKRPQHGGLDKETVIFWRCAACDVIFCDILLF